MHETGREAGRGRPGSAAPKNRSPTPVFRGFTSLRRLIALELDKSFRRSARRLDKSSSPSMRAPAGSGGSIRQVRSAIQEVIENGPAHNAVVDGDRVDDLRHVVRAEDGKLPDSSTGVRQTRVTPDTPRQPGTGSRSCDLPDARRACGGYPTFSERWRRPTRARRRRRCQDPYRAAEQQSRWAHYWSPGPPDEKNTSESRFAPVLDAGEGGERFVPTGGGHISLHRVPHLLEVVAHAKNLLRRTCKRRSIQPGARGPYGQSVSPLQKQNPNTPPRPTASYCRSRPKSDFVELGQEEFRTPGENGTRRSSALSASRPRWATPFRTSLRSWRSGSSCMIPGPARS